MTQPPNHPMDASAIRAASKPWPSVLAAAAILLALALILVPTLRRAHDSALASRCLSNVRQNAAAMLLYAEENDGGLPAASDWMDRTARYAPFGPDEPDSTYRCPAVPRGGYGYAMAEQLGFARLGQIKDPGRQPMLFESGDLSRNARSKELSLPNPPRHAQSMVAFADGRVAGIPAGRR